MTKQFENATTFMAFRRKDDARRVCNGLRARNVIAGVRASRGCNEVFGYVPAKMSADDVRSLALSLYNAA